MIQSTTTRKPSLYVILFIIWFFFVFTYCICPLHLSFNPFWYRIEVGLYLLGLFLFFKIKNKKNYFDFDTILLAFCSIEHFMGFLFVGTEEFDRLFISGMDTTLIMKGTLLASTGLLSYMMGALRFNRDEKYIAKRAKQVLSYKVIPAWMILMLFLASYALFVISGGFSFFESQYKDGVGMMKGSGKIFQAISLMTIFSNVLCARFILEYFHDGKLNKGILMPVLIIFAIAAQIAIVGNRTIFSYIVLPYIICYFSYIRKMNLVKTLVLMIAGVMAMYGIQILRQGGDTYTTSVFFLFSDVIAPSRAFIGGLDYVDHFGYTFGVTMLHSFYALIPGLATAIGDSASIGSAEAITMYLADGVTTGGLGTTIIVDIYLCFGFIGVIIFMYFGGMLVHRTWKSPINDILIQISLFSCCVFIGRSAYFSPLRLIVWSILFCNILVGLKNGSKKNNVFSR